MEGKYRHIKTGNDYEVIGVAKVQTGEPLVDYDRVVVYRSESGSIWVRPVEEFDERFTPIPSPSKGE